MHCSRDVRHPGGTLAALRYVYPAVGCYHFGWWLDTFSPIRQWECSNQTHIFNVCQCHLWVLWVFDEVLTSRRNRGLSGMKTSPTSAARAGNRHTNMNNLQLCIWNSEPMAKPQPEKSDRAQTVRWNPFKQHSTRFKSLSVRFSFVHSCVRPIHLICVLNNRKIWLKIHTLCLLSNNGLCF